MTVAFLVGAVASGFTVAGLATLLIWAATVIARSSAPWSLAPWVVAILTALVTTGTYFAERIAHRRSLERSRSIGEPWAFRD